MNEFGVNGIKFYDADWFIDLDRAVAFAKGLVEHDLKVSWGASINPNDVLKARRRHPDLLRLLAASGCSRLLMGVESGSDRVLREIVQKDVTRAQILDVSRAISSAGIRGSYTFIIGFPGETAHEQSETFDLIEELWQLPTPPETRVHIFTPYPGTPLYQTALDHGFVPPGNLEDWAHCDYYRSHTPWTSPVHAEKARAYTRQTGSRDHFLAVPA